MTLMTSIFKDWAGFLSVKAASFIPVAKGELSKQENCRFLWQEELRQ